MRLRSGSWFYRKWLTNPVRKLSTNKLEKGTGTILESQGGDILERQISSRLGAIKVGFIDNCMIWEQYLVLLISVLF